MLNILRCLDFHILYRRCFYKTRGKSQCYLFCRRPFVPVEEEDRRHSRARRERSESQGAQRKDDYVVGVGVGQLSAARTARSLPVLNWVAYNFKI